MQVVSHNETPKGKERKGKERCSTMPAYSTMVAFFKKLAVQLRIMVAMVVPVAEETWIGKK